MYQNNTGYSLYASGDRNIPSEVIAAEEARVGALRAEELAARTEFTGSALPTFDTHAAAYYRHMLSKRPERPSITYVPENTERNSGGLFNPRRVQSSSTEEEQEEWERYTHIIGTYGEAGQLNIAAKGRALLIGPDLAAVNRASASNRSIGGPRQVRSAL